jgi:hypothetical protein
VAFTGTTGGGGGSASATGAIPTGTAAQTAASRAKRLCTSKEPFKMPTTGTDASAEGMNGNGVMLEHQPRRCRRVRCQRQQRTSATAQCPTAMRANTWISRRPDVVGMAAQYQRNDDPTQPDSGGVSRHRRRGHRRSPTPSYVSSSTGGAAGIGSTEAPRSTGLGST